MKFAISFRSSIAMCALLLCSGAHAQTTPSQQIHVLTLLGRPVQFVVADKQGLFAKYGIEVVNDNKKNSDELRADLAAGKGDVAYLAVDNAVAMVELAHQDVVIVMGGEGSQNELIAQPGTKSIADLRGKTLIVDAPNTAYALQMKKIMLLGGLTAGKDYEIKPFGATPQRLAAMREHQEFAGSMLGPPVSLVARGHPRIAIRLSHCSPPSSKHSVGCSIPPTKRKSSPCSPRSFIFPRISRRNTTGRA